MRAAVLAIAALAGCEIDDELAAPMHVGVFKMVADADGVGECGLLLPDTDAPAPAIGLDFEPCPGIGGSTDAILERGADRLRVVVEYTGLPVDEGATVPPPAAIVRVDGQVQTAGLSLRAIAGPIVAFDGRLDVPQAPGDALSLTVEANAGYAAAPHVFALRAPTPRLTIDDCAAPGCRRVAAVGDVVVTVAIAATTARTAILRQRVRGVLQPAVIPLTLSTPHGRELQNVTTIPVPAEVTGPGGAGAWILSAEVDGVEVIGPAIGLDAPVITRGLLCGAACEPPANSRTGLRVIAPRHIRPAVAQVDVFVGGAPHLLGATVHLLTESASADTVSGILDLTLPDRPGATLTIETSVAGFAADTLSTRLGAAVP